MAGEESTDTRGPAAKAAVMKIAVLKEQVDGERRVAATPQTAKKFVALGAAVAVEAGAGDAATYPDQAYRDAGAAVADRGTTLAGPRIVLGVQGPDPAGLAGTASGSWIVAGLNPFGSGENGRARIDAYAPPVSRRWRWS